MNTETRSEPSRSRARRSGWRLTCTRLRPVADSWASMSSSRPSRSASVRTTAKGAPRRTSASVGAPRNDASVASQASASSRLVLPSPFAPTRAVSPGARSICADA